MSGDYMGILVDTTELMDAYARLKKIPLAKVVKHAARDFTQAGQKATPNSVISRSEWWIATRYEQTQETYQTKKGKTRTRTTWARGEDGHKKKIGDSWFIHDSKISGSSVRRTFARSGIKLSRMRVHRGWSKASWIGIMRSLGMTTNKEPSKDLEKAKYLSSAVTRGNLMNTVIELTDQIAFDRFGKGGADVTSPEIKQRGLELAAWRLSKEFDKEARKQWHP